MYYFDDGSGIKDVFLYIRQSTDEKSGKQVRSLGDQHEHCKELANRLGLNIVDVFKEDKSAMRPNNRPVFEAMLKELSFKSDEKRRADGILAWHPDRLSRNALEAGKVIQMLDDDLIKDMFFPAYAFHNDPSGKEHLFIEFARAKGYSDRLSVAVSRGSEGREREGAMVYPVKFGYQKKREVPENPKFCSLFPIPCETNFPIIKHAFKLRMEGVSLDDTLLSLEENGLRPKKGKVTRSSLAYWLNDPFYFGNWIINRDKPDERIVDLSTITLADGTTFTPVVTEQEFWQCQKRLTDGKTIRRHTSHVNPICGTVQCASCGENMRPALRQVKRAGGIKKPQLGFECQTKSKNGDWCDQGRVKAGILFDHIANVLESVTLEKTEYQQFMIGIDSLLSKKKAEVKKNRELYTKRLKKLKTEKADTILRKSMMIQAGDFGKDEREWFAGKIEKLNDQIAKTESANRKLTGDINQKTMSFRKFIELTQNLNEMWLSADFEKKRVISEKILLNLTLEGREVRSVTWKSPFSEWANDPNIQCGGADRTKIEPCFTRLWTTFSRKQEVLRDFLTLSNIPEY